MGKTGLGMSNIAFAILAQVAVIGFACSRPDAIPTPEPGTSMPTVSPTQRVAPVSPSPPLEPSTTPVRVAAMPSASPVPFAVNFLAGIGVAQSDHIETYVQPLSVSYDTARGFAPLVEDILVKLWDSFDTPPPSGMRLVFVSPDPRTPERDQRCPIRGITAPHGSEHTVAASRDDDPQAGRLTAVLEQDTVGETFPRGGERRGVPLDAGVRQQTRTVSSQASDRVVAVLADDDTPPVQVLFVAEHELAHQLAHERIGAGGDPILGEGLATWLARESFLPFRDWASVDEAVRGFLAGGTYVSLGEAFADDPPGLSVEECWLRRDTRYTEYASFVAYLMENHGMEKFAQLWKSVPQSAAVAIVVMGNTRVTPVPVPTPPPAPDPKRFLADYEGVYGRSLEELEQEWLTSVESAIP